MSKPQKNNRRRMKFRVEIVTGSTLKAAAVAYDLLSARSNGSVAYVGRLIYDFTEAPPADLSPSLVDYRLARSQFYVAAKRPTDMLSLEQAEREGLINAIDGHNGQSQSADDMDGTGGIPAEARTIAGFNREALNDRVHRLVQNVIDYETRILPLTKGDAVSNGMSRVPVHILASSVGGMGSGSLVWIVTECIIPCAQANGVEAKVVPELLTLGNLQTHYPKKARINECIILKFFQAFATGAFVDPVTRRVIKVPFDHVRLFSNINNHGSISSLRKLVYHQARLSHYIWNTPAGGDLQEREPDIGDWGYGMFEDPLCGYTASVAVAHWDKPRLLDSCAYMASAVFAESLLPEADSDRALNDATSFATASNLVESEEQNQLTSAIGRPDELAGETVYGRTDKVLVDKIAGATGLQKGAQLTEGVASIRNNDIPSVYEPMMLGQARSLLDAAKERLKKLLDQILREPQGLSKAAMFLQFLLMILERSRGAVAEKLSELQEYLAAHEQAIAEASEQLQQLVQQGWLRQATSFQLIRAINLALEESGRAAINYQLQMATCNIATQEVLMPLSDSLEQMLARLLSTRQRLAEFARHCTNTAESKASTTNDLKVPVGLELVNAEYVDSWFAGHVDRSGGQESFVANLRGLFLQKYESFAALMDLSPEKMEETLVALCRSVFEPTAENTNVLAEFRSIYDDEATRQRILSELISEGEGRVLIEGEVNKSVAWVKTANVPLEQDAEWMRRKLEDADHKPGKWQVAANPADPETISMVQLRGNISLTPLIKRSNIPDDYESWKLLVAVAAEPVSAIAVSPDPTPRQFRRVLAKAIAAGLLTINEKQCYTFRSSTGEEWLLGEDGQAVHERLHPRYRQLVFAESYFAGELVDSEQQIVARLDQMKAQLRSDRQPSDRLLQLIDETALDECLQQAQLLRSWASRIRKLRRAVRS
jgi:hypothetical protein